MKNDKSILLCIKSVARYILLIPVLRRFLSSICAHSLITYLKAIPYTKRIFIFSIPEHGNIGDQAIVVAEELFFKKYLPQYQLIQIPSSLDHPIAKYLGNTVEHSDNHIITVHGGGFLGNLWTSPKYFTKNIFNNFPKNRIVFFPNTVFFEQKRNVSQEILQTKKDFLSHPDCHIFIRDKSINFLKTHIVGSNFSRAYSCPDIVLSLNYSKAKFERVGVLFCFRSDKEKLCDDQCISILKDEFAKRKIEIKITDTVQPYNIVSSCREYEVEKKLHEFQRARLVVTDRLHGMIFSTITGTPCIALNNSSGKVEGVWSLWLQKFSYIRFANNCEEAKNAIDELLFLGGQDYNPSVFDTYWQQLADVVSGK